MTVWLRTRDAVDHFGVSSQTLRRWRHEGMPHYVVRGAILYDRDEADAWLKRHRVARYVQRYLRPIPGRQGWL